MRRSPSSSTSGSTARLPSGSASAASSWTAPSSRSSPIKGPTFAAQPLRALSAKVLSASLTAIEGRLVEVAAALLCELFRGEGLLQIVVGAGLERLLHLVEPALGRDHQDRHLVA